MRLRKRGSGNDWVSVILEPHRIIQTKERHFKSLAMTVLQSFEHWVLLTASVRIKCCKVYDMIWYV